MCLVPPAPALPTATCGCCPHCPKLDLKSALGAGQAAKASDRWTAAPDKQTEPRRPDPADSGKVTRKHRLHDVFTLGLLAFWPAGAFGEPAKGLEGRHHGW